MTDISTHYSYLYRILQDIATNSFLSPQLIFKGGTALMFFYDLPRFSVDLDFTLINKGEEEEVYRQLLGITKEYGKIADSNLGFYGPKVVLDYGIGEWNLKIEVSNRYWGEQSDLMSLDGFSINVMNPSDMYAHKLIALSERKGVANRDIFDILFFEENDITPNEVLIEKRKGISLLDQLKTDLTILENYPQNRVLSSLAPLLTPEKAQWARTHLLSSTVAQLEKRLRAEELKQRLTLNIPDAMKIRRKGIKR
ncbi:nucleotidyl transferase AbiEii/AbiGii toxin family protein [Porphyromonas levii]|uniref:nucleotidyl transferase AbiEii/AbiGii toxin family protein n=1 Tax=Porphyromonas levii TaxID=28114 RepID=UPI0003751E42|nr:nucleotidyl transferase AbiEii/AbiGii toxin family protein [Porphyromonas levii]MBR8766506.1 hypothetical protein [Porphyromonas levii]MBR8774586.1 hypothetical protein [Porphyromonas levii]MBR8801730.1 hypothetical protein [Porphyromonas levii]